MHFLHVCLVLEVSIIQKVAPSLFYGFTYSIVFLFSKQFIKHKMSTLPLYKTTIVQLWVQLGKMAYITFMGSPQLKYVTDYFLYHIIINLTRVTSEANVSMASREAKKARRQKLEVLPRTKLSLTEKVSLLCPLKFIDLYAYKGFLE